MLSAKEIYSFIHFCLYFVYIFLFILLFNLMLNTFTRQFLYLILIAFDIFIWFIFIALSLHLVIGRAKKALRNVCLASFSDYIKGLDLLLHFII